MNGKKISGNASKATLPGGQKLSDKIQENKVKQGLNNNQNKLSSNNIQDNVNGKENSKQNNKNDNKGKLANTAQGLGSEALKKSLKAAFPVVPQFIINKLVDSKIGQALIEKTLTKTKNKIVFGLVAGVSTFLMFLLILAAFAAAIVSPLSFIGDVVKSIGDFFVSIWNSAIGKGWCATETECQTANEEKYYEKLTEALNKYKGSCTINPNLITATIFYGQMVSEEGITDTEDKEGEKDDAPVTYYDYSNVSETSVRYKTADSQISKLIDVYLTGETAAEDDVSDDENDESDTGALKDYESCSFAADKYKKYLIDHYIDWAYPSVITATRTKEKIAEEIMTIGEVSQSNAGITIVEDTDGLFTMLPGNLNLRKTSDPANCRCHPTQKVYQSHKGVDIGGASYGTTVLALDDGVIEDIIIATSLRCGSSIIKLKHIDINGDVYYTRYVHLNRNSNTLLQSYKKGDSVSKGQVIGYVGGSKSEDSCSTDPHLHFEVHNSDGNPINPLVALNNFNSGLPILSNQELITVCSVNGKACS